MLPSTQFVRPRSGQGTQFGPPAQPPSANGARERIIGSSPGLLLAIERARQAARSGADILLEAESGTGKELLARLIHDESARAGGPFVAINCAAVPETLLESELFGHVRGAFTGALASNPGKLVLASGGSLLLDEIGEMPLLLQPKLLRVLQEREFYRLGDSRPMHVDLRVISSTNRRLQLLVEEGRFREDLYYRLSVIPLSLPPLRERGEDVIELAEYFAAQFAAPAAPPPLSDSFRAQLRAHTWPGNVRELANTMRRAVALCDGEEIGARQPQLAPARPLASSAMWLRPGLSLRELEKTLLEITLNATAGNRTQAAELLGVSLRTVRNKIREHGLPPRRLP
ncbi:MAG: sigma 54-interacting transcriptional regulator [Candidatus Korobacteraceae bacterium]